MFTHMCKLEELQTWQLQLFTRRHLVTRCLKACFASHFSFLVGSNHPFGHACHRACATKAIEMSDMPLSSIHITLTSYG